MIKAGDDRFEPSGFFHLRTPLLPFEDFAALSEGLEAPGAADLEAALERDRALVVGRLHALGGRPAVREALALGSPQLLQILDEGRADPGTGRGRRLERALLHYLARTATRATPFGLFAGCSVGTIDQQTRLSLAPASEYRRRSRLDGDYLYALAGELARELKPALVHRPNSSLYRAAGQIRYVEVRVAGEARTHHLVAAERSDHLDAALARAAAGATLDEVVDAVRGDGDGDVPVATAAAYVDELVSAQILVPDLGFHLTGPEPTDDLVDQLAAHPGSRDAAAVLAGARDELAAIDAGGLGADPERYRRIAGSLERLPARVDPARLFQVDMTKPAAVATLGGAVLAEIERGAGLLARLARPRPDDALSRLRDAFAARYDSRPVPLVEMLDAEIGLAVGSGTEASPLLAGLAFPGGPDTPAPWGRREDHLLARLGEALLTGRQEIALDARDLELMADDDPPPMPDAFDVLATVAAGSPAALDRRDFRVRVAGASGPSGARLLGRFCHGDGELRAHVERHLRAEERLDPDAIYAEIVHLPEGRVGNVVARPVLRGHEIPYLARSGAPGDRQIPVTDLSVALEGGRFVLRSERLGRRVVPRLTSAHNYGWGALPLYRFLALLQHEGTIPSVEFTWGPLAHAPFLPRVTSGRVVLSLATWTLGADELRPLLGGSRAELYRRVQRLRADRGLPRFVTVVEGERVLPIDLDSALGVESFAHVVGNSDRAQVAEPFGWPDQLCVEGPEGRFAAELVIPFVRVAARAPLPPAPRQPAPASVRRSFPPGSEWTYAKLYAGSATADRVLAEEIGPLAGELVGTGAADRWFFIRYSDPDFHLRVRFRGDRGAARAALEAAIARLHGAGLVRRAQFDTYEREVERYGGAGAIDLAERAFEADSDAVLEILALLEPGDAGADERWRMALCGVAALLADLGLDVPARRDLMKRLREAFGRELGAGARLARQLGERLARERASLEELLDAGDDHPLAPGVEALRRRSERLAPVFGELHALDRAGALTATLEDVAAAHLHMHCNRMLRSAPRAHELVIYDLLGRLYESQIARARRARAA